MNELKEYSKTLLLEKLKEKYTFSMNGEYLLTSLEGLHVDDIFNITEIYDSLEYDLDQIKRWNDFNEAE